MRKSKYVSAILLIAGISYSASSYAKEEDSFEFEGITYTYSVQKVGNRHNIVGHTSPDGARFSLNVKDGAVFGRFDGSPVRFDVPKTSIVKNASAETIASR